MGQTHTAKAPTEHLLEDLERAARGLAARTLAAQARYQNALYEWDRAVRRERGLDISRI
ncbi:MAG: hypothetical protein FJ086_04110 [Deltaproteobacteria bacterium]|nr:hypothetical protein [Deltaproteobacteria bacterium]